MCVSGLSFRTRFERFISFPTLGLKTRRETNWGEKEEEGGTHLLRVIVVQSLVEKGEHEPVAGLGAGDHEGVVAVLRVEGQVVHLAERFHVDGESPAALDALAHHRVAPALQISEINVKQTIVDQRKDAIAGVSVVPKGTRSALCC